VVAIAFLIRLAVVVGLLSQVQSHTIDYNDFGWESWEMGWVARSIVLGHGFSAPFLPITGPTALVPPLYPYLLAGVFHLFGVNTVKVAFAILSFNSFCSSLTCLPLYFLVRDSLNGRAARIAAIAWAIYPFAVYFSADRVWDYALTSLLFTTCLMMANRLADRGYGYWAAFGALYGVTILSNPSVTSMLPVLLLIAMYRKWRNGGTWLKKAALASLMMVVVIAPWQVRNYKVMHASFFIRDGFWLEAYAGNNGDTHESNSAFAHPASNPAEMTKYVQMGEIKYMAEKKTLTLNFIKGHPGFFAVATLRRVLRFWTGYWSFDPHYLKYEPFDLPNVPFCLFLFWAMARGIRRWLREDYRTALPYLLALAIFPLPYYLTHSSMDYRQPIEPVIIILVCVGLFGKRIFSDHSSSPALELQESDTVPA